MSIGKINRHIIPLIWIGIIAWGIWFILEIIVWVGERL